MAVNSTRKGKDREREAAAYLRSLGFPSARRGQQYAGGEDSPDVVVDELSLHFEIKSETGMDLGTKPLTEACDQARGDAGDGNPWVVLWRPNNKKWRATTMLHGLTLTTCGDEEITALLCMIGRPH